MKIPLFYYGREEYEMASSTVKSLDDLRLIIAYRPLEEFKEIPLGDLPVLENEQALELYNSIKKNDEEAEAKREHICEVYCLYL